ncbi:MAG: hypothetical protein KKA67_09810 [Spirochaetes bacterium]|nr:hypothetical protein [Spirochaetota bacterium]MBU1081065.1 hypothetical protein [Spirochaetota bacterium]
MTKRGKVRARGAAAAIAACFLGVGLSAGAQDRGFPLRGDFYVDLAAPPSALAFQGVVDPAYEARIPDGEAAAALLDEARWTFSGMVWGFSYVYTPSDRARSVAELFEIEPLAPAAASAIAPSVVSTRLEGTALVAELEYYLDRAKRLELEAWKSSRAVEQGRGSSPAFSVPSLESGPREEGDGSPAPVAGRRAAVVAAVREALRAYLRELTHNKPREVRGSFAFASPPRIFLKEGSWIASVRIYARVDEIVSYGAY